MARGSKVALLTDDLLRAIEGYVDARFDELMRRRESGMSSILGTTSVYDCREALKQAIKSVVEG